MGNDSHILEKHVVPAGSLIVKEGEEGNCAYLIQTGKVSVFTHDGKKRVELASLGAGQIFGEMALIFDEPRTASVEAVESCSLILITRNHMKSKLERSDPTVQAIMEMLTQRIVSTNNTLLNKKEGVEDLSNACRIIYQNVVHSLPSEQQQNFQGAVLPKLEACLEAISDFQKSIAENL